MISSKTHPALYKSPPTFQALSSVLISLTICVVDEIKAGNESFLGKLQYLSGTNTGEDGQAEEKTEDYFIFNDEYVEEEDVK